MEGFKERNSRQREYGSWGVAVPGRPAEGAGQGRPPGTNTVQQCPES